jgi:hypothetical protein
MNSLSATKVFDYMRHDPTETGQSYDAIFDAVGNLSFLRLRHALTPRGAFGSAGGLVNFAMVPLTVRSRGRRAVFAAPAFSQPNVRFIAELNGVRRPSVQSSIAPIPSTRSWRLPATSRPRTGDDTPLFRYLRDVNQLNKDGSLRAPSAPAPASPS